MAHGNEAVGELPWTGERLVTGVSGDVALEHLHRYALAMELASDKTVLDIACGEGYGSDLLAGVGRWVVGIDINPDSIRHASRKYVRDNLEFRVGSATRLPIGPASVDLIVSFETLEHLAEHEAMMGEIKRVLAPGGILIMSTPDRRNYSDIPKYANPYHVKELYCDEFAELIDRHFSSSVILGQRVCEGSLLVPFATEGVEHEEFRSYQGNFQGFRNEAGLRFPIYLLAIASDEEVTRLPSPSLFEGEAIPSNKDLQVSMRDGLYGEATGEILLLKQAIASGDAELQRRAEEIAEKLQQVAERDQQVAERDQQVAERDQQVAERDRRIAERDQWIAARDQQVVLAMGERAKVEAALDVASRALAEQVRSLAEEEGRRVRAEAALAGVEAALDVASRALAEQGRSLAEEEGRRVRAEAALAGLMDSRSWRITAPLRHSGRLVRAAGRRARSAGRAARACLNSLGSGPKARNDPATPRHHLGHHDVQAAKLGVEQPPQPSQGHGPRLE
jgi:ubiquinone/menaquinone biosynthesis C-methylase UbiE